MQLEKIDISVIICCYNSQNRIANTLNYLSNQVIGGLSVEVILIDNNCSDDTVKVASTEWDNLGNPFPLIIVTETIAGLSSARKRGILSASGEIVIFCDDDNWLNHDYLKIAYDIMSANESIGVLAGESRAISNIELPTWFYSYYGHYACGVLAIDSGDVTDRYWVWGAGMVLRNSVMRRLYSKNSHITNGRTGESLESGDDVEICYWHILDDKILWYDNRLKLQHYMSSDRLNILTAKKQFEAQHKSAERLRKISDLVSHYYNFRLGNLRLKNVLLNLFKLKLRSFLNDAYYLLLFKIKKS
jgi:glycosyltransferase involved in cell wall biosynthesis